MLLCAILRYYFCYMRYTVLLLWVLALPLISYSQNLTGIWKGNFVQGFGALQEQYKYEVQIKQEKNKSLKGVTYSYLDVVFYGKASLQGIFMDKSNNVLMKENHMLEVKSTNGMNSACVMTCYLTYHKEGKDEYLEGTYTSVNVRDSQPCGAGKVYLKKSVESDFYKEDFLLDGSKYKKPGMRIKPGAEAFLLPGDSSATSKKATPPAVVKPSAPKPSTANPPAAKPSTDKPLAVKPPNNKPATGKPRTSPPAVNKPHRDSAIAVVPDNIRLLQKPDTLPLPPSRQIPVPSILRERESKLEKVFTVHDPEITIKLYDNGEIDNDTVTVYHNNEPVLVKRQLTTKPLTVQIKATATDNRHELVMVADNLGTTPPNTALMVITCGNQRYELSLASDMKRSAKVIIQYEP